MCEYTFSEHRHRLAAWGAASGASASPCCRFPVRQGVRLIEDCGLKEIAVGGWDALPNPEDFDNCHGQWRNALVECAAQLLGERYGDHFSHGVAAKLINGYFKTIFVCGMTDDLNNLNDEQSQKLNAIHPPIDRLLLAELATHNVGGKRNFWRQHRDIGWSNFSSDQYQAVIEGVRTCTGGALWRIEEHWVGHQ